MLAYDSSLRSTKLGSRRLCSSAWPCSCTVRINRCALASPGRVLLGAGCLLLCRLHARTSQSFGQQHHTYRLHSVHQGQSRLLFSLRDYLPNATRRRRFHQRCQWFACLQCALLITGAKHLSFRSYRFVGGTLHHSKSTRLFAVEWHRAWQVVSQVLQHWR